MEKADLVPLIDDPPATMLPADVPEEPVAAARVWPCRACGTFLGVCHLIVGIALLVFDVLTNSISETAFAITASLAFIVCAIFAFIATRRLDRAAQLLLGFFSLFSLAMCIAMFLESARVVNRGECPEPSPVCGPNSIAAHTVLICFALLELTICFATIIVCYRSLRGAYAVSKAHSPYSTLIQGDFRQFSLMPRVVATHIFRGFAAFRSASVEKRGEFV